MEKLKMHTPDMTQDNIARIRDLFPSCVMETKDAQGNIKLAVDFDQLRQELSNQIIDGPQERYHLNWPGKREALLTANAPIAKTLRPARDESVDFDTTKNLFIEGDNLEALKLLQETYLGKIKMIYIDPPYNTGNDFIYEDDFAEDTTEFLRRSNQKDEAGNRLITNTDANGRFHSDWLSMFYTRVKLARSFLKDDGFLFVSVDDVEVANARKVCDEIFGEGNFLECLIWKKKYGGGAKTKYYVGLHEYILCYCKEKSCIENIEIPYGEENRKYYKYTDEKVNVRGPYRLQPLNTNSNDLRENLIFAIEIDGEEIWPESQWQWSRERVKKALDDKEIVVSATNEKKSVNFKQYLRDEDGEERKAKPFSIIEDIYTQHGTKEIKDLFGNGKTFSFPKPSSLLLEIQKIFVENDYIVMDFFAGSSSTADAVMQLNAKDAGNRKFIMVQIPEACDQKSEAYKTGFKNISDLSKERIRRAGKKILEGVCHEGWSKDIGFRVLKIDTSNMADIYYVPDAVKQSDLLKSVENIKQGRNDPEDLLFQVLLDWGVDLALPIRKEKIQGKNVFFVDENALVACFDTGVNEDLVKELAGRKPLRVVFRDNGFESDAVKINVDQIFKQLSPGTEVKSI